MTPAQLDLLLAAEHHLSAPVGTPQRASDEDPSIDLFALAAAARRGR